MFVFSVAEDAVVMRRLWYAIFSFFFYMNTIKGGGGNFYTMAIFYHGNQVTLRGGNMTSQFLHHGSLVQVMCSGVLKF